jgi:hypothetical protein
MCFTSSPKTTSTSSFMMTVIRNSRMKSKDGIMSTTEEFVAWELVQQQTWPFCVLCSVLQ